MMVKDLAVVDFVVEPGGGASLLGRIGSRVASRVAQGMFVVALVWGGCYGRRGSTI